MTCIKAPPLRLRYHAAMTSRIPPASPPRRTPLAVRLAYGQLILATIAFAAVPALALRRNDTSASPVAAGAPAETADTSASALAPDAGAPGSSSPAGRGEAIFARSCAACHQPAGTGIPGAFPPLAGSDFLLADPERAVGIVLHGLSGPVTVNGVAYVSAMPPQPLEDADVAAVLTHVLQAWGNRGPAVSPGTVARIRAAGPKP